MSLRLLVLCTCTIAPLAAADAPPPSNPPPTPDQALQRLREGNDRFASGRATHPHADAARRAETLRGGQHPFATVVACSDSRVPVELIFDQGIGDLFVVRVAGNVCATDETGSIEYALEHLGTPLLVVLGHRDCGAVTAVVRHSHEHGNIPALVEHIRPAVEQVEQRRPELQGPARIAEAVRINVWHGIEDVLRNSPLAREQVESGRLRIVGAIYDLETARIDWLGPHPGEKRLLEESGGGGSEDRPGMERGRAATRPVP